MKSTSTAKHRYMFGRRILISFDRQLSDNDLDTFARTLGRPAVYLGMYDEQYPVYYQAEYDLDENTTIRCQVLEYSQYETLRQMYKETGAITTHIPFIYTKGGPLVKVEPKGVWVAYEWDRSGVVIFETELDAMRYGAKNHCGDVKFWEFGKELLAKDA